MGRPRGIKRHAGRPILFIKREWDYDTGKQATERKTEPGAGWGAKALHFLRRPAREEKPLPVPVHFLQKDILICPGFRQYS